MAYKFLNSSLTLLVLTIGLAFGDFCPDQLLLNPCECENIENGIIRCTGTQFYNLKRVFHSLSRELDDRKKHFTEFFLNNTAITSLPENTFSDITFDRMLLSDAINLKHIHSHAFSSTSLKTKSFVAYNTSLENSLPYNDIFSALSLFRNLEALRISLSNLTSIPENAFRPIIGLQSNLTRIDFSSNKIETIGSNAFHYLISLTSVDLSWNQIERVSENAFSFLKASKNKLNIQLYNNKIDDDSFQTGVFNTFDRPAKLNLDKNDLKFLNSHAFSAFFDANVKNEIEFSHLNCSDCRSFWLLDNGKYIKQVGLLKCSNERKLNDNSNFADCVHL